MLVRPLYFNATRCNFTVILSRVPGSTNLIADALSHFQMKRFRALVPTAAINPTPILVSECDPGLTSEAQLYMDRRGVALSTRRMYNSGTAQYIAFCWQFHIQPYPASPTTLQFFTTHLARSVSYRTIKIYLAGIRLRHIELGYPDPAAAPIPKYFVSGIKHVHEAHQRERLPITGHSPPTQAPLNPLCEVVIPR